MPSTGGEMYAAAPSQNARLERSCSVDAHETALTIAAAADSNAELEAAFTAHYARIARVIARLVRDYGRAEELAVEVFVKWWRHPEARGDGAVGWLHRTAIRSGLDELRRQTRRERYERFFSILRGAQATPEDLHASKDERRRVRIVLAVMRRRDAALLLLRADGCSYDELASALTLHPSSIGTLLARAQRTFRTEYLKRYDSN
jgi:RNA polymerase sigma-70 factor (ECF subfamily)